MSEENNNNNGDAGQAVAVVPVREAQAVVGRYAKKLLNDDKERADKFLTHMAVMARSDWKLAQSTPESLATALLACVHLNMIPNTPEGLAYVIAYKNNRTGKYEAQFQMGYKGMVQLAQRSGMVNGITANLVFPEDEFEVDMAQQKISHKPDWSIDRTDWSKATAVYASASLPNGGLVFDVLSRSEVDKVRKVVKAKSSDAPWETWEEMMVKKTAVKRLTKMLPQNPDTDLLQRAAAWDSASQMRKLKADAEGQIIDVPVDAAPLSDDQKAEITEEAKSVAARLKAEAEAETQE